MSFRRFTPIAFATIVMALAAPAFAQTADSARNDDDLPTQVAQKVVDSVRDMNEKYTPPSVRPQVEKVIDQAQQAVDASRAGAHRAD